MKRAQSTVELALILPFLLGLLVITLQGGVIISDQVALEHFAYVGAQYAVSQNQQATTSAITSYILQQMCGAGATTAPLTSSTTPPASSATTKYCKPEPSGVPGPFMPPTATTPKLIAVSGAAVSLQPRPHPDFGLWTDALAASSCTAQNWSLRLQISNSTVYRSGAGTPNDTTITVSFKSVSGSQQAPNVKLSATGYPPGSTGTGGGTPIPADPVISPSGSQYPQQTTIYINGANATPGSWKITVGGTDQCGIGPSGGAANIFVNVSSLGVTATVTPAAAPTISGVDPPSICAGQQTVINIVGTNFVAGDTVSFGANLPAVNVTYVSAADLQVTTPALATGLYSPTVTDPVTGLQGSLLNPITATVACLTPPPPPPQPQCGQNTGAAVGASEEAIITITWNEPLVVPWFGGTYITLQAQQVVLCQSPARPNPSP